MEDLEEDPKSLLSNLSLLQITDKIEVILDEFEKTKSRKEKQNLNAQFIILKDEYHQRLGLNNIYVKSLL